MGQLKFTVVEQVSNLNSPSKSCYYFNFHVSNPLLAFSSNLALCLFAPVGVRVAFAAASFFVFGPPAGSVAVAAAAVAAAAVAAAAAAVEFAQGKSRLRVVSVGLSSSQGAALRGEQGRRNGRGVRSGAGRSGGHGGHSQGQDSLEGAHGVETQTEPYVRLW